MFKFFKQPFAYLKKSSIWLCEKKYVGVFDKKLFLYLLDFNSPKNSL